MFNILQFGYVRENSCWTVNVATLLLHAFSSLAVFQGNNFEVIKIITIFPFHKWVAVIFEMDLLSEGVPSGNSLAQSHVP